MKTENWQIRDKTGKTNIIDVLLQYCSFKIESVFSFTSLGYFKRSRKLTKISIETNITKKVDSNFKSFLFESIEIFLFPEVPTTLSRNVSKAKNNEKLGTSLCNEQIVLLGGCITKTIENCMKILIQKVIMWTIRVFLKFLLVQTKINAAKVDVSPAMKKQIEKKISESVHSKPRIGFFMHSVWNKTLKWRSFRV